MGQVFVPDTVPESKHEVFHRTVEALASLEGAVAIVLGGSYARGTHHAHSDLDLGLYYSESSPFSIEEIRRIARQLCSGTSPVVSDFYEWGPWVNGGAWIQTEAGKVDFLYRISDKGTLDAIQKFSLCPPWLCKERYRGSGSSGRDLRAVVSSGWLT